MRVVGEVTVSIIGVVGGSGVVKAGGVFGQGGDATAVLGGQGGRTVRFITEAVLLCNPPTNFDANTLRF